MDGATGALLHRDRLRRAVVFEGSQNDPLTAFFEMSQSLSRDLLAVVTPQARAETRVLFRR